ncbi:MAG: nitroreductase family protein [Clostridia bacterium]|nr:nitroreductase family protein [Clostridia bacterium]
MNVSEAIKSRRSIRSYLPKPIEEEKLSQLLEAARLAPGARVEQDFKMILVTDDSLKNGLVSASGGQSFLAEAPVVLVMCYNNNRTMLCGEPVRPIDCSIALSFMLLEAEELGLGMCWLGAFRADEAKKILGVPEDYKVFAILPIGYAANNGYATRRKKIEDLVLYNKWQKK